MAIRSMNDVLLVCPHCGAEFLPGAETCSDCHVPLVASVDMHPVLLESSEGLVDVGGFAQPNVARAFSEALEQAQIPYHATSVPVEYDENEWVRHRRTPSSYLPGFAFHYYVQPPHEVFARLLYGVIDERPSLPPSQAVQVALRQLPPDEPRFDSDPIEVEVPDFDVPDASLPTRPADVTHRVILFTMLAMVTGLVALFHIGAVSVGARGFEWWLAFVGWSLLSLSLLWKSRRIHSQWLDSVTEA